MKPRRRSAPKPSRASTGPEVERAAGRRRNLLATLALSVLTLVAYSSSFGAGFAFDNRGLLLEDPRIRVATAQNLGLILEHTYWWPYGESGLYRPVATLSYLFNHAILGNGEHPAGYHCVNLLLHAGNVLLVFALARRLLRDHWPSAFVAALWAVHPILTESVTNIVGRPDLLAGMAVLSGLLVYLKSAEATGWRRFAWLAALMVVTTVGVFSKESAVTLPGVIALYELTWWKERKGVRALVLGCCAMLPAIQALAYQRAAVLSRLPATVFPFWDNPLTGAEFWTAKLTALKVMGRDLALLLWPARLSCDYSYAQISLSAGAPQDWLAWGAVAAVAVLAMLAFRFQRALFFVTGMAFVTFLPTSNLLFPIGTIMAERFLYLPSIALAFWVVVVSYAISRRIGRDALAPAVLCVIVAGLGIRTWIRNADWRDDLHLMSAAVEVSPHSYKSHSALAAALYDADPSHSLLERAIAEAEKSLAILELLPDARKPPAVYDRAGDFYLSLGDLAQKRGPDGRPMASEESLRAYRRAAELLVHARSIVEANQQQLVAVARAHGKPAPEPDGARLGDLERRLASAYLRLQDPHKAHAAAARALEADPTNPATYRRLSVALLKSGRADDAAVALVQGVIVTADMSLRQDLLDLYRQGLDQSGCAVVASGAHEEAINPSCPIVRRHSCAGVAGAMRLYLRLERRDLAEQLKAAALAASGCAQGPLDEILP